MELVESIERRREAHIANEHRFLMLLFYNIEQYDLSLLKSLNINIFVEDRDKDFFKLLCAAKENGEELIWFNFKTGSTTTFDSIKDYITELVDLYKPDDMIGMFAPESDIRNLKASYISNYFVCFTALKKYLSNPNKDEALEILEDDVSIAADYGLSRKETNHSAQFYTVLENSKPLFYTGLTELDKKIGAIIPGQFIYLGGRPAMGKTTLCTWLFAKCCACTDKQVLFYSLEMSGNELLKKLAALNLHVSTHAYDDIDKISPELREQTDEVLEKYNPDTHDNIHIIDGSKHIRDLLCDMRRRVRKGNVGLIFLDHIGMIEGDGDQQQNIAYASNVLCKFAHDNHVTIICVTQLNAGVDSRADHRPMQSDIQYQVAKDADKVLLMYRPDYYNKEFNGDICDAEIIVSKNRQGMPGIAHVRMHMIYGDFKDKENR